MNWRFSWHTDQTETLQYFLDNRTNSQTVKQDELLYSHMSMFTLGEFVCLCVGNLHLNHRHIRSPVCILMWVCKAWATPNPFPHSTHLKGLSLCPAWLRAWATSESGLANDLPHLPHVKGFVCVLTWACRESLLAKVLEHASHLNGFSPRSRSLLLRFVCFSLRSTADDKVII